MQTKSPRAMPSTAHPSNTRNCPHCRCALVRERRRIVDRLYSLFQPIKRYRCQNFACQWVGNFSSAKGDLDLPPHRVPVAFVVHMALVAVGVVVVIVFSNLEPTGWAENEDPQWSSFSELDAPLGRTVTQTPSR